MDATTVGGLIAGGAAVIGTVAAYLGKRGENVTSRFNSEIDQVQEERDGLLKRLAERDTQIIALQEQRRIDLIRITQLEVEIIRLGGDLQR